MRKKIKPIYIIIALCLIFVLGGCGITPGMSDGIQITDMRGRVVTVSENIRRVAVLDPFAGYAVIMLGAGDKMVATTGGVRRDLLLQAMLPSLADAVVVKEEGAINGESLLNLRPDFAIIKSEDYDKKTERDKLDRLRIPYLVIDYRSMEDQCAAMAIIGRAFGLSEEADAYAEYYRGVVERVSLITADIPAEERLSLYHSLNTATTTDAAESIGAEWIAVTGAENVSVQAEMLFDRTEYITSIEEIYVWDPDVIICNETGINEYILGQARWQGLRAVQEGRVYQVPIGVSRMGHFNSIEVPLAIYWLSGLLYPERFAGFDFITELKSFYAQFFDYTLDEATVASILSGVGIRESGVGTTAQ